ncbi:MAG: carbohydrate ABC transporter substrate-binding protein [Spirochaetaceae bacterium]|nr:MAG: carbohydrate ABC transporter substrate-binding protein [Spirochaetaceae bacterium]
MKEKRVHARRRRLLAPILIVFTIVLFLSACGDRSTEVEGEVTIRMWTHDALYVQFFQKRIDAMNASNPDLTIVLDAQEMPDPIVSFVSATVAGEQLPDFIGVEQGDFPILMEDGVVEDVLVDLTDRIGDRFSDFVEGRWALYTYNDRIYGVESALSAVAYYHQPEIFESRGLSVPTTWNEFVDVGEVLGAEGVSIGVADNMADGLFGMMYLQRGGQFFDENGELVFGQGDNRRYAKEVLEIIRSLVDSGALYIVYGDEFWGSTIPTAFSQGRLAGIIMPDWYNTSLLQPGVEDMAGQWRLAPMPLWDDPDAHTTSVWGGTGFAITQASDHQDLVWEILEDGYLTLDGQLDRYATIGFFPTMYEALEHPDVVDVEHEFYGGQRIGRVISDVALDTPPLWQSPARASFNSALGDMLAPFIDGDIDAETFIDRVVEITEADAGL